MTNKAKQNIYEVITSQVVEGLKKDGLNWFKPWNTTDADGLAMNHITKKAYKGINQLLLSYQIRSMGYSSCSFLSYKQASKLGGQVRKGEKGHMVIYWNVGFLVQVGKKQIWVNQTTLGKMGLTPTSKEVLRKSVSPRYYKVFNTDQVDGIEGLSVEDKKKALEGTIYEPIDNVEEVVDNYKNIPSIAHSGSRAYYQRNTHHVQMPVKDNFESIDDYYKTLFHELTHSTGHKDLLDRDTLTDNAGFGSDTYSKEELVAEMGCMFLVGITGINPKDNNDNSQAYINNWISNLKKNPKWIMWASTQSQKAVEFMLKGEKVNTDK